MTLRARLLSKFASWALSKNPAGGYAGEDDERWAYTIVGEDGSPYLTRILLTRLPVLDLIRKHLKVGVYIHHFHRSDGDQDLHDHPWEFGAALVLNGAYVEERLDRVEQDYELVGQADDSSGGRFHGYKLVTKHLTTTKLVRFWNFLTKDDFHSVRELKGDVWTLFVTGERVQEWGFLVDGQKVPWREYLSGLDVARGDALDRIGKKYGLQREALADIDYATGAGPTWTWSEPDADYRERIRAAMRAESAKESKESRETKQ